MACLPTLRKSGLLIPVPECTQSKLSNVSSISFGTRLTPTRAPIMPPTMQALVSVSPPYWMVYLIAFSYAEFGFGNY